MPWRRNGPGSPGTCTTTWARASPRSACWRTASAAGPSARTWIRGWGNWRASPADLVRAVREVAQGGVPMTGEVARKVIQSFRRSTGVAAEEPLTHREEEVLELLAKGFPTAEIAQALGIGRETVNTHLKHIYGKLHLRSRTEAVIKYLE